jgi:hypothetical protein
MSHDATGLGTRVGRQTFPTFELTAFLGRFAKGQRKQPTWDPLWPSRTMAGQVAGKQVVGCLL